MLMNRKNFHFTQIPDTTNDVIFLKSSKDHFWLFLPNGDLFHTQLYMDPQHHAKFQKVSSGQGRGSKNGLKV